MPLRFLDYIKLSNFIEQSGPLILTSLLYYMQVAYSILSNDGHTFYDVLFEH